MATAQVAGGGAGSNATSGWVAFSDGLPLYKQEGTPATGSGGFLVFVLISVVVWLFNTYINVRQHRRYSDTEVDPRLLRLVETLPPIGSGGGSGIAEAGNEGVGNSGGGDDDSDSSAHAAGPASDADAGGDNDGIGSGDHRESGNAAAGTDVADAPPQYTTYAEKIKAKFPASQAYAKDKSSFGFVQSTFNMLQGLVFLFVGFTPFAWDLAADVMAAVVPEAYRSDTVQACVFISLTGVVDTVISLPFSVYSTFVVEQRHGFNKTTPATFVKDLLMGLALQAVFGLPIIAMVLYIIESTGDYFFVYVSLAIMAVTFFMMTIYPTVIAPLYNKFEPLSDGSLKSRIEALAASQDFPLTKLFTIDGSKRSAHSNAYLYGFCNSKRIVLFDTLLKQCEEEEIVAILGHEIGHWKMGHTSKNMVLSQVQTFLIFYAVSFFVGHAGMFHTFGFRDTPTIIGLALFLDCAFTPLNPLLQFLMSYLTRLYEFQADAYAAKLGHAKPLQVGLVKLQLENLGALSVDPLYSAYHYSHPPVVERLRALAAFEKKGE